MWIDREQLGFEITSGFCITDGRVGTAKIKQKKSQYLLRLPKGKLKLEHRTKHAYMVLNMLVGILS